MMNTRTLLALAILATPLSSAPRDAHAFCGFYVAKADTKIFNKASQVVIARNEDKTVMTMANDFKGDPKEFAVVIPVPTKLEKDQIHVGEKGLIDHLDAYSAPRLVEYFDDNPCDIRMTMMARSAVESAGPTAGGGAADRAKSLGVTIEAQYTVGEYDISILSAKESNGLETFLTESGYKLPKGASRVLESYIKQKMRFFVAKVNLTEQAKLGYTYLRPLQVAYESPKFMLPIRLGTVNADGPQELFIYTLTKKGRVETTNYRTVRLPTGMDIPLFVKDEFAQFYRAMFDEQVKREKMKTLFLEYAWDMNWCDPCAADPLSQDELRKLGVFWLNQPEQPVAQTRPGGRRKILPMPVPPPGGGTQDVFVTRIHLRYDAENFPEDLVFQETPDRENFQGRYVLRHPFTEKAELKKCEAGKDYLKALPKRGDEEAKALASLTGWDIGEIRKKAKKYKPQDDEPEVPEVKESKKPKKWYQNLWPEDEEKSPDKKGS